MSRSYKKNPIYTDRTRGAKWQKRQANKVVRKDRRIFNHKSYKKLYQTYNIHDWISRWSAAEVRMDYYTRVWWYNGKSEYTLQENYKTEKEFFDKYWKKYYKRK